MWRMLVSIFVELFVLILVFSSLFLEFSCHLLVFFLLEEILYR
jgi:hypothetical protein